MTRGMSMKDVLLDSLAVAWKELQVVFADRGALIVLFLLPVLMASMMGSASVPKGGGPPQLPVALVNQDTGAFGAQVASILRGISALRLQELSLPAAAEDAVAAGKALAAVVIPRNLSQNIEAHVPSQVQVVVDPAQEQYGGIVTGIMKDVLAPVALQGEIQYGIRAVLSELGLYNQADPNARRAIEAQNLGVMMTQVQAMQENPLIRVESEDPVGVKRLLPSDVFAVFMPAFTVMFAFFLMPAVAGELWKEKAQGSLRRLLSAPIWRGSIIAGKMVAYMIVVVLQVLLVFGVGNIAFGMGLGRSPAGLLAVTLALALAATAIGMMVGAVTRSAQQADATGMVLGFLLAGLGGCIQVGNRPLFRATGVLGTISRLTPHAHALEGYMRLLAEDAGLWQVLPQVGMLLAMAVVFFSVAMWRFKFE